MARLRRSDLHLVRGSGLVDPQHPPQPDLCDYTGGVSPKGAEADASRVEDEQTRGGSAAVGRVLNWEMYE